MNKDLNDYLTYPILFAIVGPLIFITPLFGVIMFLPIMGLSDLYDLIIPGNFSETGIHVEIGFASIIFKTTSAWLFYISFFFFLGIIVASLKKFFSKENFEFSRYIPLRYALVTTVGLSLISLILVSTFEILLENIKFTTPSQTNFVCDKENSVEILPGGKISFKMKKDDLTISTYVANVNEELKTFTFEFFIEDQERYREKLQSCINKDGKSVLDLYAEVTPN
jgi:hypothetical protein